MAHVSAPQLATDLGVRLQGLETEFHRAYWDSQVEATPENEARRAELELELRRVKGDAQLLEAVTAALTEEVHDPVVQRQLEVLKLSFTANQMDDAHRSEIVRTSTGIESEFATFRPDVNGRPLNDNEIEEILRTSEDERLRKTTWEASKEIGAVVAGRLRDLVRLRNEVALQLGFADYYRMALELQELSEGWLLARLDELDRLTEEPFRKWKVAIDSSVAERFGVDRVMPWHYADPFFQQPPPEGRLDLDPFFDGRAAVALAERTFSAWGIDISGVLKASDLYPRDLKCQHAFCLDVDRSTDDVRILANVVPGERWIEVLLHESGHAAYDMSTDPRLPYLLRRPSHIFVTESIALLSGGLVTNPRWMVDIAEIPADRVAPIQDRLVAQTAAEALLFARWGLVMSHFERELYADPEGDLDGRWWELVARFQLVEAPDDPPPGAWAAKIHLSASPVYYHNYLLGHMLARQLAEAIVHSCGGLVGVPTAGEFLMTRVFKPGNLLRWDSLIEEATGSTLSAEGFGRFVASAV